MTAKVLTVASTKGGAGKTTIVMALASTLAAEGLRIAVVDADPNRAYASWAEGATSPCQSMQQSWAGSSASEPTTISQYSPKRLERSSHQAS